MSTTQKPTLTFFGATGGCTLAALSLALSAGYTCSALVRSKSKLTSLLAARNIPDTTITAHLTIHEGNAKDVVAVKAALQKNTPEGGVSDVVISGIGGTPKFSPNPLKPTLDDPTICQDCTTTLLRALESLRSASPNNYTPPLLCVISTTGLTQTRDIPFAMIPLYHWLLAVPHADKKVMEDLVDSAPEGLLRGSVILRPSLLVDGKRNGPKKVKAGYEGREKSGNAERWGDVEGVSVGYAITREDVGGFIFEEVVERGGGEWVGKKVSLTE